MKKILISFLVVGCGVCLMNYKDTNSALSLATAVTLGLLTIVMTIGTASDEIIEAIKKK